MELSPTGRLTACVRSPLPNQPFPWIPVQKWRNIPHWVLGLSAMVPQPKTSIHQTCLSRPKHRWFSTTLPTGVRTVKHLGSPSHFRGVWASLAPRCEAPRGRMTPRLPVNDWGTCFSHALASWVARLTKKKKQGGIRCLPRPVSLIFVNIKETEPRGMDSYPAVLKSRGLPGSSWAARRLIGQSAFVIP